jgi:putative ATP-dependent endonuclease of OLD family
MRISKLSIKNFRSIENLELDLDALCALVGPNNAGKSNVLLALHRVLAYDRTSVLRFDPSADRFGHDLERDVEIVATLDPPHPYRKAQRLEPTAVHALSFRLTAYKEKARAGEPRLEQACLDKGGKVASVHTGTKEGGGRRYEPLTSIPTEIQQAVPLIHVRADRRLSDQLPSARYSVLRTLLDDVDRDFRDPKSIVKVTRRDGTTVTMPRSERWGQLMTAAMELLRTDQFRALEDDINRNALRQLGFNPNEDDLSLAFGPLPTIDFYRALELQLTEAGLTVDASTLGQGFQNAVFMAILEAYERRRKRGAIFLIEEPEIALHPQAQRALYATLRKISRTNQVIYTTHSPHFVGIADFDKIRLVQRTGGQTTIRSSTLERTDALDEKLRKEVDPERSELFFARRVLVVEGDTEKLAFPEYAARLSLDLDRAGGTIIEAGGKRNVLPLAQVAASFGIATGLIYDRDARSFKDKRDEEKEINEQLVAFQDASKGTRSWCLDPDYETVLRGTLGEASYQVHCQQHPGVTKAVRARRIAEDKSTAIPSQYEEALRWLAGEA